MSGSQLSNYIIFFLPFIGALFTTSILTNNYQILATALLYALAGFIAEYLLGKIIVFFLVDKLWTYLQDPLDNGHATPWSLLGFMVGGFFFISINLIVEAF